MAAWVHSSVCATITVVGGTNRSARGTGLSHLPTADGRTRLSAEPARCCPATSSCALHSRASSAVDTSDPQRTRDLRMLVLAVCALIVSLVSLLALVSTMRETVILRGEVHALTQVITEPPDPRILGTRLPEAVQSLTSGFMSDAADGATFATAFLSSDCGSCVQLVRDLNIATGTSPDLTQRVSFVLTARSGQVSEVESLLATTLFSVLRDDGSIARECDVRATPMIVTWTPATGGEVHEYSYGGSANWILDRIQPAVESLLREH